MKTNHRDLALRVAAVLTLTGIGLIVAAVWHGAGATAGLATLGVAIGALGVVLGVGASADTNEKAATPDPDGERCDWLPEDAHRTAFDAWLISCNKCGWEALVRTRQEANTVLLGHRRPDDGG